MIIFKKKFSCLLARCESVSVISERAGGNDNARFRIAPFTATARRGYETQTRDGIELHSLPRLSIRFSLVKRAILSRSAEKRGTHRH